MKSIKKTCLLLLIILIGCSTIQSKEIKPFTSDGCSSFPDGTLKQKELWHSCCVEHDKSYWMGGTEKQRLEADNELKSCVEKTGEKVIAKLMLAGVRVGGSAYWPTSFRWGYGWNYERKYQKLSKDELVKAKELLKAYDKSQEEINKKLTETK